MRQALRPYVTAGIAIVGASVIAVSPFTPPRHNAQYRPVQLVDYDEYTLSQLVSTTETNWSGLESILSSSHWLSDPDISQGLSTLFSDLSTGTSNSVTNPLSELAEGALALLNSGDGFNAASAAFTAVSDNVESALSGGDYSAALTDLENGGTTVLDAFLNGYPESVGSGGLISPEFGLLTNTADGAATGEIDSLAQISNTVADEVANLGGANLTTGSLPLLTGNLDLSVSLNQILSDLGLTSLTVNGLLGDLGIPSSFSVGDVLNLLGLTDSSGFSIGQILSDLGLSDSSGISLSQALGDLGGLDSINVGQILTDLGLSDSSGISLGQALGDLNVGSSLSVNQILTDLGITSAADPDPTFNVESLLTDLGVNPTGTIDLDSILSALSISPTQGIGIDTILDDLGIPSGDLTFSVPSISIPVDSILQTIGIPTSGNITLPVSLDSIIQSLGISGVTLSTIKSLLGSTGSNDLSIPISDVYSALGLSSEISGNTDITFNVPSLTIPVSTILSDLGLGSDPTISLNTILGALGLTDTDPTFSVSSILSDLNIGGSSTIDLDSLLTDLGISPTGTIDLSSILSGLGLSSTDSITIGDLLNVLNLGDSSTLSLSSILSDLGLSGDDTITIGDVLNFLNLSDTSSLGLSSILSDLGLSGNDTITIGDLLNFLNLSDSTQAINVGDALNFLGLNDNSSISIDNILSALGIDPDSNLLTDLGIPSSLTLNPSIDLDGGPVATYFQDLSQDLLAALGTIAPVSSDLPSLLGTDPTVDLEPLLSSLLSDLGVPATIDGTLSVDLTNVLAEVLPSLF